MLKEQAVFLNRLAMATDFLLLVISLWLSHFLISSSGSILQEFHSYAWVLLIAGPVWHFMLNYQRLYSSVRRLTYQDIFIKLFDVQLAGGVIVASFIFLFDEQNFSRSLFVTFILISFVLLLVEKLLLRYALGYFRKRGFNIRNLLIVGTRDKARRFHRLIEEHSDWGLKVVGFLQALEDEPLQQEVEGHTVLGYAHDLLEVCKQYPIDEVVFCLPRDLILNAEDYLRDLEELGITVRMALDFYEARHSKRELSFFHNEIPILTFHTKSLDAQQLAIKRALDVAGAFVGLALTALFFPFIAAAIKFDSPGPLLFSQERVGESGRTFKCWKFRSMYIDAEERKKELLAQNEMSGAIFKIKDDPRITRVGRFLRKTSLDELPQFWNVLRGEMSLVGTRPPTPGEVAQYENWHRRRISIKPGISGLWQVSGRNQIDDFDEIVRLDLNYIDNWSIWLDLKILLKTLRVVFLREGSC